MNGLIPITLAPTPGGRVVITVGWNPATREHTAFGLLAPVATARDEHGAPCPECGRCMVDAATFRHYGWYSQITAPGYLPHGDPCGPGTDHQPWCSALSDTRARRFPGFGGAMDATHIDLSEGNALAGDCLIARDGDGWWGLDLAEAGRLGDPEGDLEGDAYWAHAAWVRSETLGSTPQEAAERLARLLADAGLFPAEGA